jgi:uncharacterized protein with HEPN domain
MTPHWIAHAIYILDSIDLVYAYTKGEAQSLNQQLLHDAVIRRIQTLSESACKLPEDIQQKHPHINWRNINRYRNILVHDYLAEIDESEIWRVIQEDLPLLQAALLEHLPHWRDLRDEYRRNNQ